jgi:hypothetical protein
MAQAFDAASFHTQGEAFRLAGPVNATRAAAATAISIAEFSATPSTLVYRPVAGRAARISLVSMPGSSPAFNDSEGVVVMKDWLAALPH